MRHRIQVGATIRYNQSGSTIWSFIRYSRAQYFFRRPNQWGVNAISEAWRQVKNLTILIWFLYVLEMIKQLVALIGFANLKRKTLRQG